MAPQTLSDMLTAAGVSTHDTDLLTQAYPDAEPDAFIAGLHWVTLAYLDLKAPALPAPTCEPWADIANGMQNAAPGDMEDAFRNGLSQATVALQTALFNTVMAHLNWQQTQTQGANPNAPKKAGAKVTSTELLDVLKKEGWTFRTNQVDDSLEVNGAPMDDGMFATIHERLRDLGYARWLAAADDSMLAEGRRNAYHPVREYLEGQQWHGDSQIDLLASFFQDKEGAFPTYLRKWLIGAVRRVMTGQEHRVLVLESKQKLGKSWFARWLCQALPEYFDDAALLPDDKDCAAKALRTWVWEISELGSTTRRQDIDALKSFLSRKIFKFRPAYGHFEIKKPGLASFIGTANDSSGLFGDPTGSRRFMTCAITSIDWRGYTVACDVNQVWAEAYAAWKEGESPDLDDTESERAEDINKAYQFVDPVELLFGRMYPFADKNDKTVWTSTAEILMTLQAAGLGNNAKANAMALASTLKRLGFEKDRQNGQQGYWGVR